MKIFNISLEKSVGAVVVREGLNNEKEFLLLHYPSGHWDFPKGHVENGETDEETLRREVEEETGIIDLDIVPVFKDQIRYFYRAKGHEREERIKNNEGCNIFKKVVFYIAKTTASDVRISFEHIEFEWLGYEEAMDRITFENGKDILRKAHEFLMQLF